MAETRPFAGFGELGVWADVNPSGRLANRAWSGASRTR